MKDLLLPCNGTHTRSGINGILVAEVDHPQGRVQVANVHLDPLRVWTMEERFALPAQLLWRQGAIHRSEIKQVFDNLRPDLPTLVLGDFNSASQAAPNRLRALGFTDSFAAVTQNPDRAHTLHFTLLGIHAGRRIDYIFHDRNFETMASRTSSGQPSDHDPVISVLSFQEERRSDQ